MIPQCVFDGSLATAFGPQSTDQGITVTYVPICGDHAATWTSGSDWVCDPYILIDGEIEPCAGGCGEYLEVASALRDSGYSGYYCESCYLKIVR